APPGREGVLAHADEPEPLGPFYASALFGGVALYLAGYVLFKRRMHRTLSLPRLVAIGVLLAALAAAVCPPPRWPGWPVRSSPWPGWSWSRPSGMHRPDAASASPDPGITRPGAGRSRRCGPAAPGRGRRRRRGAGCRAGPWCGADDGRGGPRGRG